MADILITQPNGLISIIPLHRSDIVQMPLSIKYPDSLSLIRTGTVALVWANNYKPSFPVWNYSIMFLTFGISNIYLSKCNCIRNEMQPHISLHFFVDSSFIITQHSFCAAVQQSCSKVLAQISISPLRFTRQ